jgi:hypothetical protein
MHRNTPKILQRVNLRLSEAPVAALALDPHIRQELRLDVLADGGSPILACYSLASTELSSRSYATIHFN